MARRKIFVVSIASCLALWIGIGSARAATEYTSVWTAGGNLTGCSTTHCGRFISKKAWAVTGNGEPKLIAVSSNETCYPINSQSEAGSTQSGGDWYVSTWIDIDGGGGNVVCAEQWWRMSFIEQ